MPKLGVAIVRGRSMQPTLSEGDRLLVRYGGQTPPPGSLALVRLPERPLSIKRLARRESGGWWIERDNPYEGVDSWVVGTVEDQDVVAVVLCRLWPKPTLFGGRLRAPRRPSG